MHQLWVIIKKWGVELKEKNQVSREVVLMIIFEDVSLEDVLSVITSIAYVENLTHIFTRASI